MTSEISTAHQKRPSILGWRLLNGLLIIVWFFILFMNLFAFSAEGRAPPGYSVLIVFLAAAHITFPIALIVSWVTRNVAVQKFPSIAIAIQLAAVFLGFVYVLAFRG